MNLTVNKLPSTTWNKLHMNEAAVSLEDDLDCLIPRADYDSDEFSWDGDRTESLRLPGELTEVTKRASLGSGFTRNDVQMQKPLVLTYAYEPQERAASRLSLLAAESSHLKAVVVLRGEASVSALQAEMIVGKNAVLDLCLVDLLGSETLCLNHIAGKLDEGAQLNVTRLDLGGKKIYSGVNVDLLGDRSGYNSETGYHVIPGQVLDMNYVAVHHGRSTNCEMQVNGTLEDGARKVFRGTIDFQKGCAGAKAAENEKVLLMGENLVNQTLPVILCKEEDVEGSHGASIGQLDDKVLFYLATRGIPAEAAQAMIAQARIDAICAKIPVEEIRQQVLEFEKVRGTSHGEEL